MIKETTTRKIVFPVSRIIDDLLPAIEPGVLVADIIKLDMDGSFANVQRTPITTGNLIEEKVYSFSKSELIDKILINYVESLAVSMIEDWEISGTNAVVTLTPTFLIME